MTKDQPENDNKFVWFNKAARKFLEFCKSFDTKSPLDLLYLFTSIIKFIYETESNDLNFLSYITCGSDEDYHYMKIKVSKNGERSFSIYFSLEEISIRKEYNIGSHPFSWEDETIKFGNENYSSIWAWWKEEQNGNIPRN